MSSTTLTELTVSLNDCFSKKIVPRIVSKFEEITGQKHSKIFLENGSNKDDLLTLGVFLDEYDTLLVYWYSNEEIFNRIADYYKKAINKFVRVHLNNELLELSKNNNALPSLLRAIIHRAKDWIDNSTLIEVNKTVNQRFSELLDLEELKVALDQNYITSKQFFLSYRKLTKDYTTKDFIQEISNTYIFDKPFPLLVQGYILYNIIKLLDFKSLDSFNYIKIDDATAISDVRSLLRWINSQLNRNIHIVVARRSINLLISALNDTEIWSLFEEGLITCPSKKSIEENLQLVYSKRRFDKNWIKEQCIQDRMSQDITILDDIELKILLVEHLDNKHKKHLQEHSEGFLKLFLWLDQPDSNYNWELIITHFSELPSKYQVKLFKYIFYLLAKNALSISINELYNQLINPNKLPCAAVCFISYLLKIKGNNPNVSISSKHLNASLGQLTLDELNEISEFFYYCSGHLALTYNEPDREYFSYNGFVTKEYYNNKEYYAITFYDRPHNVCNREIEWLDNSWVQRYKTILTENIETIIVNNKYLIDTSNEIAVRQFVIALDLDDKCCLIDDKEALIQKGLLPTNNAYLPKYTNTLLPYENRKYKVCRGTNYPDIDPNTKIPFFWCNKKVCTRLRHIISPIEEWESYRFSDLLYIILGRDKSILDTIWSVTSEVSQFVHDYLTQLHNTIAQEVHAETSSMEIISHKSNEQDEIGELPIDFCVIQNIFEDNSCDDDEDDIDIESNDYEDYGEPNTYDRYRGTYAQDEMGYSDDDIDTIFDGDPDAYWNID